MKKRNRCSPGIAALGLAIFFASPPRLLHGQAQGNRSSVAVTYVAEDASGKVELLRRDFPAITYLQDPLDRKVF